MPPRHPREVNDRPIPSLSPSSSAKGVLPPKHGVDGRSGAVCLFSPRPGVLLDGARYQRGRASRTGNWSCSSSLRRPRRSWRWPHFAESASTTCCPIASSGAIFAADARLATAALASRSVTAPDRGRGTSTPRSRSSTRPGRKTAQERCDQDRMVPLPA